MLPAGFGKSRATVDAWEDEVDYSGYEWFREPPPPRPEPPPPMPEPEPYLPPPDVIAQNEMIDFALRSAPNVLYGRYKQYGQMGVLGWCPEFGELIEAIQTLGRAGNLFVSTRAQALQACEEILRLHLKLDLQLIVICLSAQVRRMRHFLDTERVQEYDDYPVPDFPLDPYQYK